MLESNRKIVFESLLEIIIAITLIIISIPIWNNIEMNNYRETAEYYSSNDFGNSAE